LDQQGVAPISEVDFGTSATASAAKSGAVSTSPDLQRLIDAWPSLPVAARAAIIAMLEATR
jgi:hypothetical protein